MSSSVAVDPMRLPEWDHETAAEVDAVETESHPARRDARGVRILAGTGTDRRPPWPQRRLNDALAELGPARPDVLGVAPGVAPYPPLAAEDDLEADQDVVQAALLDHSSGEVDIAPPTAARPSARVELPPPPRPYLLPAANESFENQPFEPAPIEQAMLVWEQAGLSGVDAQGADIVRALAFAARPSNDIALSASHMVGLRHEHDDEQERPPMIIERALAEQGLGMAAFAPEARRINPVTPLAIGFSLSLVAGAALYVAMMAG